MKIDCQWFSSNLEAYFSDELNVDSARLAGEHLESCTACSEQVHALRNIDPLIKQVFDFRLAQARTAAPSHSPRRTTLALAGTGIVFAIVLGFAVKLQDSPQIPQVTNDNLTAIPDPPPVEDQGDKVTGSDPVKLAKPDPATGAPVPQPGTPTPPVAGGPAFAVVDPVGYATTLDTYRGYILIFGVWSSDQPKTAESLERIYKAFSDNPKLRILGIAAHPGDKAIGTTFPVVFNHGSQLLGVPTGEFLILDTAGNRQMEGSLTTDTSTLIPEIRAKLAQLGIK